jgi:hypothetical protein
MFVDIVIIAHAGPGKSNQLPTQHVFVSAVDGIAKHPFNGVLPEKREKQGGLYSLERFVLLRGLQPIESRQTLQPFRVDFSWSRFALIP